MKRHLLNLLVAISLLVFVAAFATDLQSRRTLYIFSRAVGVTVQRIELVDGQVIASTADDPQNLFVAEYKTPSWALHRVDVRESSHGPIFPSFHYLDQHPYRRITNYRELAIPLWPIMIASAVLPTVRAS